MSVDCIVSNSACLIALERIRPLDILLRVYPTIWIPEAVKVEIGFTTDINYGCIGMIKNLAFWLENIEMEGASIAPLHHEYHPNVAGIDMTGYWCR
ncbi:MAG: hypothetical protein F6J96_33030 [Symploca sp. SIO1C2]|nr:hypothetical protein [Symploca sp. SIO1C2]